MAAACERYDADNRSAVHAVRVELNPAYPRRQDPNETVHLRETGNWMDLRHGSMSNGLLILL